MAEGYLISSPDFLVQQGGKSALFPNHLSARGGQRNCIRKDERYSATSEVC
ncbi:hypothetical protein BN432_0654 [Erwinia amylovora Ea356]|nr:hypothetical protein BN432_0654 [Erwinia amylovora Ea356]